MYEVFLECEEDEHRHEEQSKGDEKQNAPDPGQYATYELFHTPRLLRREA